MKVHDKRSALALSLLPDSLQRIVRSRAGDYDPETILLSLKGSHTLSISGAYSAAYPDDPEEAALQVMESCAESGIEIRTLWDERYPELVKEIPDPPLVLYIRGDFHEPATRIAMVGTRRADNRSLAVGRRLAGELAGEGVVLVSGLARGIDTSAHLGALEKGGSTLAVLPRGLDAVYPATNLNLARRIVASPGSACLSEFPPASNTDKWTFVRRNRIISGLASGTVVVQAGEKSGALITARHALEQGRDVFACTGYTFSDNYRGCAALLRDGAIPVFETGDVLRGMGQDLLLFPEEEKKKERDLPPPDDTGIEARMIRLCSGEGKSQDELVRELGLPAEELAGICSLLELEGRIIRREGRIFIT